ncbi:MAG: KamA family radical SAM protein [Planctomycetes bacterium]|nr:KamA family radical SAM protein [Planctomycetota bacterium]
MDNQEIGATAPSVGIPSDVRTEIDSVPEEPPSSRRRLARPARRKPAREATAPPRHHVLPTLELVRDVPPDNPAAVIGERARAFRAAHFPNATDAEWNDWKWQLRHRVRDLRALEQMLSLTDDERSMVASLGDRLPVGITPYYASLMDPDDPAEGLRRTMVPVGAEAIESPIELEDPLAEDADMPVPGLVHRYPDRVLFLVTSFCAVYCRYCTRSRLVGKTGEYHFNQAQYQAAIDYIARTPTIRDVLISGGDPLTMADDRIEWLLSRLRAIPHVEFIRIGSKVPAVLPQRITPELVAILRKYHPFWMSIHFTHPKEVTPEVAEACARLADAGIPLGSQTVLMKGVNDDVATMKSLMHALLKIRVRPYYIYQMDPIPGSAHFRTPIEKGIEIIEGLRGHTTGYAVPQYVIDAPGGGGKLPIQPQYIVGREGDYVILRNYAGETFRYPDPVTPIGSNGVVNGVGDVPPRPDGSGKRRSCS